MLLLCLLLVLAGELATALPREDWRLDFVMRGRKESGLDSDSQGPRERGTMGGQAAKGQQTC